MGTALTERQLKELSRLTHKLYLCFDGDAAGEAATLRGMELAAAQGFDVRVVALPPGRDPADAPEGFEERLAGAESYLGYRVRLEIDRAPDKQQAFLRVREVLSRFQEDSPERQDAVRLAADRLDLPKETQAGFARAGPDARRARSRRGCWRRALASSAMRSPGSRRTRPARPPRRARPGALRRGAAPPRTGAPARSGRAGCRAGALAGRARRARGHRGNRRRDGRGAAPAPARAPAPPRARRAPTPSARKSSRTARESPRYRGNFA